MPRNTARLRRVLADLKAATRRRHAVTVFYNLDNNRPDEVVARELHAIAATGPTEIALVETIGNTLPRLRGYRLLADTTTRSRANVAVYVAEDFTRLRGPDWHDRRCTWDRTEGPGRHEPRSDLEYRLGRTQRLIAHQPPRAAGHAARAEGIDVLGDALTPWRRRKGLRGRLERARPRLLTWDANARAGEPGPGPDQLARLTGTRVILGRLIDQALGRRIRVHSARPVGRFGRVRLTSDHGHAIRIRWSVRAWWLPEPATPSRETRDA